ncbi:MAG: lactate racemase domain-containing protein [Candidatus Zixiibacteriota bacterium]
MKIELSYAGRSLTVEIPSSFTLDVFAPGQARHAVTESDFATEFREARGDSLASQVTSLIVVNDAYRTTPTSQILRWLDRTAPGLIDAASFLISTGAHPAPTEQQYQQIFGSLWPRVGTRVSAHDCHNRETMRSLGSDRFGGGVWVNQAVAAARQVLVIGSVEPHYFAGFTGGRKSIFPGLADFETIGRNHILANSLDAAPLRLQGNPVAEHLDSLFSLLDREKFFGIQLVTDTSRRIAGVFCGRLDNAFARAVTLAEQVYAHRISRQYDLVLCEVLPPLDANLYQVQKALENTQTAARDGGDLIILSACTEGIGSPYFFELAANWNPETNEAIDGKLHFGSHKLSRVVAIGRRIGILLCSRLAPDVVRQVYYEPLDKLQDFLYSRGQECEICNMAVVRDAAHTVLTTEATESL